MVMRCSGCGFEPSPAFAFCPQCGQRLAGAAPPSVDVQAPLPPPAAVADAADRRQVTVLFADLTGFTALVRAARSRGRARLPDRAVRSAGRGDRRAIDGFVEKFVGDAVMAVFGAPVAHEDDPQRALHAALEMLRAGRRSASVARAARPPCTLHIGVNTGPVVAGSLGAAAGGAYAVTGDTVNTTARLLSAAEPGTMLVSEATHAPRRASLRLRAGGRARRCRARPSRCRSHRLLGRWTSRASARGLAALGLAAPLVGRDAELGQLHDAFARMQAGPRAGGERGRAKPAAGKSRLVAELLARLDADAASPHRGAPRGLLVARRADLRRLRRALPRGLPGRRTPIRWTAPQQARRRAAGAGRARPRRPSIVAGAAATARAGRRPGRATSSPSSSSARSRWPRAP